MDATYAPRGPFSEGITGPEPPISFPPLGSGSDLIARLESIVGILVLPFPVLPKQISLGFFEPHRAEIEQLHTEVRFCLWAMNVSLSVYMKMLYLVDIRIRQEVSDTVGNFLADWKSGRSHELSDALDVLIISEFTKHSIREIPDMEKLQRSRDCDSISSTIVTYIRDIAVNLDNMRHGDLDSTIEILFPTTERFIGRCFFPRLACVASRLLDLIRAPCQLHSSESLSSAHSTLTSA